MRQVQSGSVGVFYCGPKALANVLKEHVAAFHKERSTVDISFHEGKAVSPKSLLTHMSVWRFVSVASPTVYIVQWPAALSTSV